MAHHDDASRIADLLARVGRRAEGPAPPAARGTRGRPLTSAHRRFSKVSAQRAASATATPSHEHRLPPSPARGLLSTSD
jgi:hypothetical protein